MNFIGFADDQAAREQKMPEWIKGWNTRVAVRAVLLDEQDRVALMYIGAYDSYKLPGGGVDEGEFLEVALKRELLEETGCTIKPIVDIGVFLEKVDERKMFQTSFCYLVRVVKKGELMLTDKEISKGFELRWVENIEKAIELISNGKTNQSHDLYIRIRDKNILLAAQKIISQNRDLVLNKE
jgi:ADP-ribose pyrophosphatase YjhB (NUDIX family)